MYNKNDCNDIVSQSNKVGLLSIHHCVNELLINKLLSSTGQYNY